MAERRPCRHCGHAHREHAAHVGCTRCSACTGYEQTPKLRCDKAGPCESWNDGCRCGVYDLPEGMTQPMINPRELDNTQFALYMRDKLAPVQ
jgi:hypothetical protein